MSEEEIIKRVEQFIDDYRQYDTRTGETIIPYKYGEGQRYVYKETYYAIQGLLDLYNKEKEKNKECIKTGDLERAVGFLMNNNDLSNYISKDKIKAKIEEVKDGTFDAKIVLQSLLEKE